MNGEVQLEVGHRTHAGMRREVNEDSLGMPEGVAPKVLARKGYLYVVADGIGGHAAGAVASNLAVRQVLRKYYRDPSPKAEESLRQAILAANQAIYEQAQEPKYAGMGATLVAALVQGNSLLVANVGDSRAYLVREGRISQITRDHSWVAEQRAAGLLTEEEARQHAYRNIILRSVGSKPDPEVDFFPRTLRSGDTVILCTDGLSDVVEVEEMLQAVDRQHPQAAVESLIELANSRGGPDNVTAVALRVAGAPTPVGGLASLSRLIRSSLWIPLVGGTVIAALILVAVLLTFGPGKPGDGTPVASVGEATAIATTVVKPTLPQELLSPQPPLIAAPTATAQAVMGVIEETAQPSAPPIRPSPKPIIHVVEPGENLTGIAEDYGLSVDELIKFNSLRNPDLVYIGKAIRIPLFEYVVQPEEILGEIAAYYGVPEEYILRVNELPNADSISVGQRLRIPWPEQSQLPPLPRVHTVRWGESLTSVAKKYEITVEQLAQANGLSPTSLLNVGQELIIPEQ